MFGNFLVHTLADLAEKAAQRTPRINWVWDGYLTYGQITILTSTWKSGKTTLVAELLRSFREGEPLLGRAVVQSHAVVLTEELMVQWWLRHSDRPFADSAVFASWHSPDLPGPEALFDFLIDYTGHPVDVLVIDPFVGFAPPGSEFNTEVLRRFLDRLRVQAMNRGFAVLILHHPRKSRGGDESAPRGLGLLASNADILLEFKHYSSLARDRYRRTLRGRSRHRETPLQVSMEWNPETGRYSLLESPEAQSYRDALPQILKLAEQHCNGLTAREFREYWNEVDGRPSRSAMHRWLQTAERDGAIRCEGEGTRQSPTRYFRVNAEERVEGGVKVADHSDNTPDPPGA